MKLTLLAAAALGAMTMTLSLGGIPEAHAICDSPSFGVLPAAGATVPPEPTLYAFIPNPHPGMRLVVEGAEASIEPVAASPAYDVMRVRVHARDPGDEFVLHWRYADGSSVRPAYYQVGATTPPPNQARVVGVTRHTDDWTCSFADTIKLELEGTAIAYRIAWADGSTTILPADARVLWPARAGAGAGAGAGEAEASSPPRVTAAELGHINCTGYSVAPEALARPRPFVLYALYVDGSEVRIGSAIAQLGKDGVRLPVELVGDDGEDGGEIASQRVIPADETWRAGRGEYDESATNDLVTTAFRRWLTIGRLTVVGALGGASALLGAALLGLFGRRRRRPDHEPRLWWL
jgi:hypothetical protein